MVLNYLNSINGNIERLSENILYYDQLVVRDPNRPKQHKVEGLSDIRKRLEPVQKVIKQDIISSSVIFTPDKMKAAMNTNPWQVLMDIRPSNYATPHPNPDMIPILFNEGNVDYLGWQLKGAVPMLFDCEYKPELWVANDNKATIRDLNNYDCNINRKEYKWFSNTVSAVGQTHFENFRFNDVHIYLNSGKIKKIENIDLYFRLVPDLSLLVVISTDYTKNSIDVAKSFIKTGLPVSLLTVNEDDLWAIGDYINVSEILIDTDIFDPVNIGIETGCSLCPAKEIFFLGNSIGLKAYPNLDAFYKMFYSAPTISNYKSG